ncbi:hypothetical protein HID58_065349, partial [Brassica napus]
SLSPGVRWRVRARTGAKGSVLASLFFSVAAASTVLLPLRYAQVYGLGFGSGDCSAAEGLVSPAVSLLPLVPWREGGAMVGCCIRLFGFGSRSFSPKIWSVSSSREEEVWFDSPRSSMGLSFRTRVSFGSGWSFLVLVVLVGRWFSSSSQSVCRWVSLPRQRALCFEFAGELVLEYNQGSCRSSLWFKGRLSMPPQWPPALPLHFKSSLSDSMACPFSGGICSSLVGSQRLQACKWFSCLLTACFERLVFAHIPTSLRFA